jgi:lipoprotein NlpD
VHRVEPGQTLYRVARAYGVPVPELARVNGISDPRNLDVGQLLFVPGADRPLEVPPHPAPLPDPALELAVPEGLAWPVPNGEILSRFGDPRGARRHAGIDIRGAEGQNVVAALDGEVVFADTLGGYGKTVVIEHEPGLESVYAHNSELFVRAGDRVKRGERLARIGRTGNATTVHCHFELRRNRVPVDPLGFFPGAGAEPSTEATAHR